MLLHQIIIRFGHLQVRIVWVIPFDHFWGRTLRTHNPGMPQTQEALLSLPQSLHILDHKDSDYKDSLSLHPDDSVNNTKFQDSLHEFTQSPNVLRIGDCDPFEVSSHDNDFVPKLSDLFDDNSASLTERFQDVTWPV